MTQVAEDVRSAVREFSPDQILDIADMLHDMIRERRRGRITRPGRGAR